MTSNTCGAIAYELIRLNSSKHPTAAPDLVHSPDDRRLWQQFQRLKKLPGHDQATVLRTLNSLADARTVGT